MMLHLQMQRSAKVINVSRQKQPVYGQGQSLCPDACQHGPRAWRHQLNRPGLDATPHAVHLFKSIMMSARRMDCVYAAGPWLLGPS